MKSSYLIKLIPFFSTFLLIIFLGLNNQKQNTRLKIIIWDTPTLSVGTYLAISISSGFIFSYLITSNIAKLTAPKQKRITKSTKESKINNQNEFVEEIINNNYENTLIERDFSDPKPTINANFRVISKNKNIYGDISNKQSDDIYNSDQYDNPDEIKDDKYERESDIKLNVRTNKLENDWKDNSFERW